LIPGIDFSEQTADSRGLPDPLSPSTLLPGRGLAARRATRMPWQLFVVDGADAKRVFPLPESGSVLIGNSHTHADICLHDLYVARVDGQIDVAEGKVQVTPQPSASGTFVNKTKVAEAQELADGDVLRVGNSHLRLEPAVVAAAPKPPPGTPEPLPHLPTERLN